MCGLCLLGSATELHAAEQWYLELRDAQVDESVVRRTVALELREIEIPAQAKQSEETEDDVSLYVRVVEHETKLIVSLWDRGEYVGRRAISNTGHASVKARRVGLAVAELARQLQEQRLRQGRALEREAELEVRRQERSQAKRRREALGLRSALELLWLPQGAWLVGPRLGLDFNGHFPLRLNGSVAWMAGALPLLKDASLGGTAPGFSQFEFSLGASWQHRFSPPLELTLGGLLAVSAVHVSDGAQVDLIEGQRDTWTSRLGARVGVSRQIRGQFWAHAELSGGAILRPVPIELGDESLRLGGGFLGASLAVTVAPSRQASEAQ